MLFSFLFVNVSHIRSTHKIYLTLVKVLYVYVQWEPICVEISTQIFQQFFSVLHSKEKISKLLLNWWLWPATFFIGKLDRNLVILGQTWNTHFPDNRKHLHISRTEPNNAIEKCRFKASATNEKMKQDTQTQVAMLYRRRLWVARPLPLFPVILWMRTMQHFKTKHNLISLLFRTLWSFSFK